MSEQKLVITDNFQRILPGDERHIGDVMDRRHAIYARNSHFTIDAYLGYLRCIKPLAMHQCALGRDYMLRLGFIPIILPPSVWGEQVHAAILPAVQNKLPVYPRPAVSFISRWYTSAIPDYWASKLEAAELLGCKPEEVRVEGVLRKCGL